MRMPSALMYDSESCSKSSFRRIHIGVLPCFRPPDPDVLGFPDVDVSGATDSCVSVKVAAIEVGVDGTSSLDKF